MEIVCEMSAAHLLQIKMQNDTSDFKLQISKVCMKLEEEWCKVDEYIETCYDKVSGNWQSTDWRECTELASAIYAKQINQSNLVVIK